MLERSTHETVPGRGGTVLVVTSGHHVLRAALFAREAGADAQVVGAPTARCFVPSAFLRELAATFLDRGRLHALLLAPLLLAPLPVTVSQRVQPVDALPRTATGRTQRHLLREPFWRSHDRQVG